jgi:hypothetical protein
LKWWFRDGWSVFFAAVCVVIFFFFVIPSAIGLHSSTQWGGMYDDRWCHADFSSGNPNEAADPPVQTETWNVGETATQRVYSTPMHSKLSCAVWVKSRCGLPSQAGWIIRWADPSFRGEHFLNGENVCDDSSLPDSSIWYPHAK